MDKSRPRKYPTVDSTLNIVREIIILVFSLIFWIYCYIAMIVIGGSLLKLNTNTVLLIRSVLNMEREGMNNVFLMMGISFGVIFIFLTLSLFFQKRKGSNYEEI